MNKNVKKYFNHYNNLEINKKTEDVDVDLKQLNFKHKFKFYAVYSAVAIVGIGSYFTVIQNIKTDSFKKVLIEKANVSPLSALFVNSYKDELKENSLEISNVINEIDELQKDNSKMKMFTYKYDDFLSEVNSGKIVIDGLKEKIMNHKSYDEYLEFYYFSYLVKNGNEKITLNGKDYAIDDIAKRVSKLTQDEAIERLYDPSQILLKNMKIESSAKNINILSIAIHSLSKLDRKQVKFYKNITLNNKIVERIENEIMRNGNIYIESQGFRKQKIQVLRLSSDYEIVRKSRLTDYNNKKAGFAKKKKENEAKLVKLEKLLVSMKNLEKSILAYQQNPEKYIINSEAVENAMEVRDENE